MKNLYNIQIIIFNTNFSLILLYECKMYNSYSTVRIG